MKFKDILFLWLGSLLIYSLVGVYQFVPGYMDAEYYYATAGDLSKGFGFFEPFIWNYLNPIQQLPAPSHLYWMPLTSLISFLGMTVGNKVNWFWGRLPFVLLASGVAPLTYVVSRKITPKTAVARFAGLLALFSGFYCAYLPTTDTFAISMLLGAGWVLLTEKALKQKGVWIFFAGLCSGLLHLSRADGLIWIATLIGFGMWECYQSKSGFKNYFVWLFLSVSGYFIVMSPWYYRNVMFFQTLFPPGNQRVLWLRNYDDLFRYPSEELNIYYWWANGMINNVGDRLYALEQNLITFFAVEAEIFQIGLIFMGAYALRDKLFSKLIWIPWLCFLFIMSMIFPYAGYRGGFFHATAAFQPFLWTFAAIGLDRFVEWGNKVRHWNKNQAWQTFFLAGVIFAFLFTWMLTYKRVIGNDVDRPVWNETEDNYQQMCFRLFQNIVDNTAVVMVNNPVGFYLACHRNAIAIPVGDLDAVKQLAQIYDVQWLILEENHPRQMANYYFHPQDFDGFQLVENEPAYKIYQFISR